MKGIIISIIAAGALIALALMYGGQKPQGDNLPVIPANNVSMVDGKQIIEILARGGYNPRHSVAKAGVPTTLRMNTNGTVDCTSVLRIPSMNITKNLPLSGATDIDLGKQPAGILVGTCGMGMYPFDISFQN